jgi:hypothetical protein
MGNGEVKIRVLYYLRCNTKNLYALNRSGDLSSIADLMNGMVHAISLGII